LPCFLNLEAGQFILPDLVQRLVQSSDSAMGWFLEESLIGLLR
jgi:hypothetical protein